MSADDPGALIRRAMDGSASAFGQLVTLYQDRLYRFLLSRCQTRADAEDALQEAFINAFKYLKSYDSRWEFSTWLYRIALRELGKLHKGRDLPIMAGEQPENGDAGPLAACIADDQRQNLWLTARAVLSEQAYTALWLRYAEDMPVSDVARVMRRPATWVKVTVHRAKGRLSKAMNGDEQEVDKVATGERRGDLADAGETVPVRMAVMKEQSQ